MKWLRKYIGWIAAIAVGGMLFWLAASAVTLQSSHQAGSPGILFGKRVSSHDYARALEAVTHEAILRYGDRHPTEAPPDQLQRQAWERLILLTEANRKGMRVSDTEVVEKIRRFSLFQDAEGRFDQRSYPLVIQYSLGTTPRVFEENVRENLKIQKLFQQAVGSPTLAPEEMKEGFRRREESVKIRYLLLPKESAAQEIANAGRQDPNQMDRAARQTGLKIISTDFFKRGEELPSLGQSGGALEPLFRLQPGEISPALPTPNGWIVAQLAEKQPADESKLESVKAELEKELLDQKRLKAYLTWYQELLKRAQLKTAGREQPSP